MKLKAMIHEADEGGFGAEVPALPGCFTQGESLKELEANLAEAIEAYQGGLRRPAKNYAIRNYA